MEKHQVYFNLLDVLEEPGCPICSLVKKKIQKLMDDFLYEQVNDPGVRKEIRKSLGFCSIHSWQLQKFGDCFGLSIVYEDLLNILKGKIKGLLAFPEKNMPKILLSQLLENKGKRGYHANVKLTCPICKEQNEIEKRHIDTLLEYFNDAEFNAAFKLSFGLCLPHLVTTLGMCKNKKAIATLFKIELEKLEALREELSEIQRKHDYRFSDEGFGKEKDSWIRAIEKMIGKEGIY